MKSKIILENLKIYAYHGVLPEEHLIGAYYILNVTLLVDLSKAAETDQLADTLNYAEANALIHKEMAQPSQLLEHVAGRIIRVLKDDFPALQGIQLRITKTNPPMQGEMDGVSVEMEVKF